MKTASGLTDKHLRFDVPAFLSQLRNVDAIHAPRWATRPSIPIRCRALLWFSTSGAFDTDLGEVDASRLGNVDRHIRRDLERWCDGADREMIEQAERDVVLWLAAARLTKVGIFTSEAQERMTNLLGATDTEGLKNFLGSLGRTEAQAVVHERIEGAQERLAELLPSQCRQISERLQAEVSRAFQ